MMHTIRVWITILFILGAQSCDVVDAPDSTSDVIIFDGQSSLKLGAPSILRSTRSVDVNSLFVEVMITYADGTQEFETVPPVPGGDAYWQLGINVPLNTSFVLSMTWYELGGTQRLDLIRITREFGGFSDSGREIFVYDFSATGVFSNVDGAPDYAGFDSDADGMTNLDERLAATDPFDIALDDIQPLLAVPVSLNLQALTGAVGTETIVLSDPGRSNRSFVATSDSTWLTPEPDSGEMAANEPFEFNVSYSCGDEEGDLEGAIVLLSNGLATSVPVQLSCQNVSAALLSAVPPELLLSAETSSTSSTILEFKNTGNAVLNYSLSSDNVWLSAQDAGGPVQAGSTESIDITAECGTTQETRSGILSIESDGGDASVNVLLSCAPPPTVLVIQRQTLNLNAQFGAPATGALVVQNTGTTPLDFTTTVDDDWLNIEPASGTIPPESNAVVSVNALCASDVTSRTNKLTINSAGGNATIAITQNCVEPSMPILSDVSADLFLAAPSGDNKASSISFSNSGSSTLTYAVESDSAWLVVVAGQGIGSIGADDSTTVTVPIEAQCAGFVGERTGKLSIDSNGGNETVNVSLTCEGAVLSNVSPESMDLSTEYSQSVQRDLSFSNTGDSDLNFTIVSDSDWLSAAVTEGQVQPSLTQLIAITATCGTADDSRSGTLRIESNGGDAVTVPVTQNCTAPSEAELANVTPNLPLTAPSGQNASGTISMSNIGNADLNYEVSSNNPWLIVATPNGSIAADDTVTVPVEAQCGGFTGNRTGVLSVTSNGGGSASVTVTLNCTEVDEPTPELSNVTASSPLTAPSGQNASGTISMSNTGDAVLNFNVASNSPWLFVEEPTGSIAAGGSATVDLEAQCQNFTGNRTGVLSVTSNGGGSASATVILNCTEVDEPTPELSNVSASSPLTAQSGQSAAGTISMSNTGDAVLIYDVVGDSNSPWLTANVPNDDSIAAGASATVPVVAQCIDITGAGFTGTRTGMLNVSSNGGGSASVSVTLNCTEAPTAILSGVPSNLALTAEPGGQNASDTISFSNSGVATLNYNVASDKPSWLTIAKPVGSVDADASATVMVTAQCGDFTGDRDGNLNITSNGGDATVTVTLSCVAPVGAKLDNVTPQVINLTTQGEPSGVVNENISFSNTGNSDLTYSVSSDAEWFCPSVAGVSNCESSKEVQGTLPPQMTASVGYTAICDAGEGSLSLSGNFTIRSNGGEDFVIPITFICGQ